MKRSIRATRLLVAPTLAAAVLLAACGSDDLGKTSGAASQQVDAPARARLWAQAEQHERSALRRGQARTYGLSAEQLDAVWPNRTEAGNRAAQRAQADSYVEQLRDRAVGNRAAQRAQADSYVEQLQGRAVGNRAAQRAQADTYVEQLQDRAEGNRAAQMAQADQYVDLQQHRAGTHRNSSGNDSYDEFVPGSRHMPMR